MTRPRRIIKTARGYEPALSEEDVLGQIRCLLEANGARVFRVVERIPWGRTRSDGGIPDLFGWWPEDCLDCMEHNNRAIHFFIEVKKPGGKLRPAQVAWIEAAQRDGVIAFKAESVEEMVSEFRKYGIEVKGL